MGDFPLMTEIGALCQLTENERVNRIINWFVHQVLTIVESLDKNGKKG